LIGDGIKIEKFFGSKMLGWCNGQNDVERQRNPIWKNRISQHAEAQSMSSKEIRFFRKLEFLFRKKLKCNTITILFYKQSL